MNGHQDFKNLWMGVKGNGRKGKGGLSFEMYYLWVMVKVLFKSPLSAGTQRDKV